MSADLRVPRDLLEALARAAWREEPAECGGLPLVIRRCQLCRGANAHAADCHAARAELILKGTQWDDLRRQVHALGMRLPRGLTGGERVYIHPEDVREIELLLFKDGKPPLGYRPLTFMGIKAVPLPWIGPPIVAPEPEGWSASMERQALEKIRRLSDAFREAADYAEERFDVRDGPEGQPRPNDWMTIHAILSKAL